jgi:hypothetical protein
MEKPGNERIGIGAHTSEYVRYGNTMRKVRLSGFSLLKFVRLFSEFKGLLYSFLICYRDVPKMAFELIPLHNEDEVYAGLHQ